jgi:lysyl-tRNA synthetase class 1
MKKNDAVKKKAAHWALEAAEKILREKGDKEKYTCASGITPSGTVHIGNFREIISVDLVARALRSLGKNVRFIYSWDDYDVFRKVPENMPGKEALSAYLRMPITMVPDPWKRDTSYARHHEVDVESVLPEVGIEPEYLYQSERYRASLYARGIRTALEKRELLRGILDRFRDEAHKIQGDWWPVSVFCGKCDRDDTEILGWDGDWTLEYRCASCSNTESVDLRCASGVKLGWRVDWPMRWAHEGVDFEPAGKDHHSEGGSFDTSRCVSKEVYGFDAPVTFRYDFIGIKGKGGKMSSSKGEVIDLPALLKVYTPELVRYLFAGTRPNTEFTISFDLDVIKNYEDYDRTERVFFGAEAAKNEEAFEKERWIYTLSQTGEPPKEMPYQAPFRHLCNLLQIADGNIDLCMERLPGVKDEQRKRLRERCIRAKNWLEEDAPEEFRFRLREGGALSPLNDAERAALARLREEVAAKIDSFDSDKACSLALYKTAEEAGVESKELFRAAYLALIGKEQGPRLAAFLRVIGGERLMSILSAY